MGQKQSSTLTAPLAIAGTRHILSNPDRLVLLSPVIYLFHMAEAAPGFVGWMNTMIRTDISRQMFTGMHLVGFLVTVGVSMLLATRKSSTSALIALIWFSFLMPGRAILLLGGTLVTGSYCPGLFTALLLYVPFFGLFFLRIRQHYGISLFMMIVMSLIGALPALGNVYYVIVNGDRIF